jgi:hypothetical protein
VSGTASTPEQIGPDMSGADSVSEAQKLDAVAASLRKAYSATVAEDVPQSLMDLLDKLR